LSLLNEELQACKAQIILLEDERLSLNDELAVSKSVRTIEISNFIF
jgi:hypothetical protein